MIEHYLNIHSDMCQCSKKGNEMQNWASRYCELNPEKFMFYLNGDFYLISYHKCMEGYSHVEFKQWLITEIIKDNKIYPKSQTERSLRLYEDLRDYRLRDKMLKKYVNQINYIYSDASGREYCITTKTDYFEQLDNQELIRDNYQKAKQFIKERADLHHLLNRLDDLCDMNIAYYSDSVEIYKTIDHLINQINKIANT